jgi:predicted amidohydrolase YtcJ
MHIVEQRCGRKLADSSYAFGSMIRMGIPTSYGTDCPVEDLNPFENIYCAVTRKDLSGNPFQGFHPDEKVDIYTAIDAYTTASAFCSFEEGVKGRIKEGYMADFAVLDRDIFSIPEDEIKSVRVLQTMVGGKTVYKDINS